MQKLPYNFVKEWVENIKYKLDSKTYNGYYDKLDIVCDQGHAFQTSFNIIRTGSKCPICYRKSQSLSMLKSFEYIKNYIESHGFTLYSNKDKYKRNTTKLRMLCPNGHEISICWSDFKRGIGCSVCSGTKKKTIEDVKQYAETFNYRCLSDKYLNCEEKLYFLCSSAHIYQASWSSFKSGHRCPKCENINKSLKYSGPGCTFWKGGISCEPYCYEWTQEFKHLIKERDGKKCLNPECSSGENLVCHHVDYNKKHCRKENLITLCLSCNSKANFDREWHMCWYKAILQKRYGYIYEEIKTC